METWAGVHYAAGSPIHGVLSGPGWKRGHRIGAGFPRDVQRETTGGMLRSNRPGLDARTPRDEPGGKVPYR